MAPLLHLCFFNSLQMYHRLCTLIVYLLMGIFNFFKKIFSSQQKIMEILTEPDDIPKKMSDFMGFMDKFLKERSENGQYPEYKNCTIEFLMLAAKYEKRIQDIEHFFLNWKGELQDKKIECFHKFLEESEAIIERIHFVVEKENRDSDLLTIRLNSLSRIFKDVDKTLNLRRFISYEKKDCLDELNSYIKIAKTIISYSFGHQLMTFFQSKIGCHHRNTDDKFTAIVGPSYMGKTQMAFNLAALGYPVMYFNFVSSDDFMQKVYKNFSEISQHMRQCINKDLQRHFPEFAKTPETDEILSHSLKEYESLGFLYELLKQTSGINSDRSSWLLDYSNLKFILYEPMSIYEFNYKYSKYLTCFICNDLTCFRKY